MPDFRLMAGDCLALMPAIETGTVDAIITDPPFGVLDCPWDSVIPFEPMWTQYKRVLRPGGAVVMFATQPFASALVMSNPKWFRYDWIWKKTLITGVLNAHHQPCRQHEAIHVFCEGRPPYYPQELLPHGKITRQGRRSANYSGEHKAPEYLQEYTNYPRTVLEFSSTGGTEHSTQKPVSLLEYLVRTYTREGETVLDSSAGSGTTGVAALRCKRKFIGIELDPHFFGIMTRRVNEVSEQDCLFAL